MNKEDEKFKRFAEDIDLLNEVYELLEKDDEEICRNIKHIETCKGSYVDTVLSSYYDELRILTIKHEQNIKYRKFINDKINELKEKLKRE
jgi:hypothetical protein